MNFMIEYFQSNEDNFVQNMRHRLVPFLQRCEKRQTLARKSLLSQFLSEVSTRDLKCPLKVSSLTCSNSFMSFADISP